MLTARLKTGAPALAPSALVASDSIGIAPICVAGALLLALLSSQLLIGGTRLLFAFPAYAFIAIAGILGAFALRHPKTWPHRSCLIGAFLFFGYILLRANFSPVPYLARSDIYSVVAGLLVYLLTVTVLTDSRIRLLIVVTLLVAALGHVLVGALQFRGNDNWMPISFLQRFDYGRRASGFYICPNHLAGLLEVLGLFGLSLTCWSRWPVWSKLLLGYATMMCYIGVILTGSRGGYLSVLTSLVVFVILSLRIVGAAGPSLRGRIGVGALAITVLAALTVFLVIQKSDYLSDRTRTVVDNKNIRLDFWRAALQQWKLSPLLGTGSRTYLYYGRQFRTDAVQMDPVYVHNDYLQLLAEYGVLGLATFLPFVLLHLRRGLITARRLGPRRVATSQRLLSNTMALNVAAVCAVAAYAVHSVFDFNLHIPANVLLMAFVFGLLANSGVEPSPARTAKMMLTMRGVLLLLAVALALQVGRLSPGEYYGERARTALRDHRPVAGLSFALKGLAFEHHNPQLYYSLGRSRFLAAEQQKSNLARDSFYRAALPAYQSARELAPLDETYWLEPGLTFDALGRFSEAEWMFDGARRLDPKSQPIRQYYEAHLKQWTGMKAANTAVSAPPGPSK